MERKTENQEEKAKSALRKIVKFLLSIQRPTESTVSIALIPNPIDMQGKKKPYAYAFLVKTEELGMDEGFFIDFLKKSIFPIFQELASDLVEIIETPAKI